MCTNYNFLQDRSFVAKQREKLKEFMRALHRKKKNQSCLGNENQIFAYVFPYLASLSTPQAVKIMKITVGLKNGTCPTWGASWPSLIISSLAEAVEQAACQPGLQEKASSLCFGLTLPPSGFVSNGSGSLQTGKLRPGEEQRANPSEREPAPGFPSSIQPNTERLHFQGSQKGAVHCMTHHMCWI